MVLTLLLLAGTLWAQSLRDTEEYQKMLEAKANYEEAYAAGDYDQAMTYAREMRRYAELVDQMANERLGFTPPPREEPDEPVYVASTKTYTVVPGDCFWLISERPDIYNDPWQWRKIYQANKNVLHDPDNPSLIHPGMVFEIPPLNAGQ
jgi:nucleoid-associated protein YgaU